MLNRLVAVLALCPAFAVAEPQTLTADIWVDNWFAMSVNGALVLEDSVPITTERSFNAETATFTADLPMTIAIIAKDFKENDTGLEYIGTRRQQMGDGGLIAQFKDASGATVAVTNSDTRCLVVHRAPVDVTCAASFNPVEDTGACASEVTEIPADWTSPSFDDSGWPAATEHSARAVGPKGGYDEIRWDGSAALIWSNDLVQDNTLLCRMVIDVRG